MAAETILGAKARRQHGAEIEALELATLALDPVRLAEAAFARMHEPLIALVALRAGAVAGYVTATTSWNGRSLNLRLLALAVAPSERRRGIGRRLLGAVLEAGCALGATRLRLCIAEENAPARALYAALGFRELARTPDGAGADSVLVCMARSTRAEITG